MTNTENTMTHEIDNSDDIIDSRDVIERIEELETAIRAAEELTIDVDEEDRAELDMLRAFVAEAADDWRTSATFVRDSHLRNYAEALAEELDLVSRDAQWPATCIDWEKAARELQVTSVEFGGVTYWVR